MRQPGYAMVACASANELREAEGGDEGEEQCGQCAGQRGLKREDEAGTEGKVTAELSRRRSTAGRCEGGSKRSMRVVPTHLHISTTRKKRSHHTYDWIHSTWPHTLKTFLFAHNPTHQIRLFSKPSVSAILYTYLTALALPSLKLVKPVTTPAKPPGTTS